MNQLMSVHNTSTPTRKLTVVTLWIVQILVALIFLFAGSMKLIVPVEEMVAQMPLTVSGTFIHFIGICEVAGALGLVLPGLTRIWRFLTPLAAAALAVEMVGAAIYTLLGGGGVSAVLPVVTGIVCAAIAYSRRAYFVRS